MIYKMFCLLVGFLIITLHYFMLKERPFLLGNNIIIIIMDVVEELDTRLKSQICHPVLLCTYTDCLLKVHVIVVSKKPKLKMLLRKKMLM